MISKILDGLYLSGIYDVGYYNIYNLNITHIINVCKDDYDSDDFDPGYESPTAPVILHKYPIEDDPRQDVSQLLDVIADQIHDLLSKGDNVLVHCVAGVSRSATMIIAYLIKYRKMGYHAAFNFVKNNRPIIWPNDGFRNQLMDFVFKCNGQTPDPNSYLNWR